jgi:hypothetical protein
MKKKTRISRYEQHLFDNLCIKTLTATKNAIIISFQNHIHLHIGESPLLLSLSLLLFWLFIYFLFI